MGTHSVVECHYWRLSLHKLSLSTTHRCAACKRYSDMGDLAGKPQQRDALHASISDAAPILTAQLDSLPSVQCSVMAGTQRCTTQLCDDSTICITAATPFSAGRREARPYAT